MWVPFLYWLKDRQNHGSDTHVFLTKNVCLVSTCVHDKHIYDRKCISTTGIEMFGICELGLVMTTEFCGRRSRRVLVSAIKLSSCINVFICTWVVYLWNKNCHSHSWNLRVLNYIPEQCRFINGCVILSYVTRSRAFSQSFVWDRLACLYVSACACMHVRIWVSTYLQGDYPCNLVISVSHFVVTCFCFCFCILFCCLNLAPTNSRQLLFNLGCLCVCMCFVSVAVVIKLVSSFIISPWYWLCWTD